MRRFAVQGVLLDLDGTLIDTVGDLAETAARMLAELQRPPRSVAEVRSYVGKGMPTLVRRCLYDGRDEPVDEALVAQGIEVFRRHYAALNGQFSAVYPGVFDTLATLRAMGLALACVTNKPEEFTLPLLERMDLDVYFPVVVCGDTLPTKKPEPHMLEHACAQLGITAERALMIGDSANDAVAARAAGMPVLLVTYGYAEGRAVDTIECDGLLSNALDALPFLVRV